MNKFIVHGIIGRFPNQCHFSDVILAQDRMTASRKFREKYPGAVVVRIEVE